MGKGARGLMQFDEDLSLKLVGDSRTLGGPDVAYGRNPSFDDRGATD